MWVKISCKKIISQFMWLQIPKWRQHCLDHETVPESAQFFVPTNMQWTQNRSQLYSGWSNAFRSQELSMVHTVFDCNVTHQLVGQQTLSQIYNWMYVLWGNESVAAHITRWKPTISSSASYQKNYFMKKIVQNMSSSWPLH